MPSHYAVCLIVKWIFSFAYFWVRRSFLVQSFSLAEWWCTLIRFRCSWLSVGVVAVFFFLFFCRNEDVVRIVQIEVFFSLASSWKHTTAQQHILIVKKFSSPSQYLRARIVSFQDNHSICGLAICWRRPNISQQGKTIYQIIKELIR